jgi:hypothetical protein
MNPLRPTQPVQATPQDGLRAYWRAMFANAALQGLVIGHRGSPWGNGDVAAPKQTAKLAVQYADALLKELEM